MFLVVDGGDGIRFGVALGSIPLGVDDEEGETVFGGKIDVANVALGVDAVDKAIVCFAAVAAPVPEADAGFDPTGVGDFVWLVEIEEKGGLDEVTRFLGDLNSAPGAGVAGFLFADGGVGESALVFSEDEIGIGGIDDRGFVQGDEAIVG